MATTTAPSPSQEERSSNKRMKEESPNDDRRSPYGSAPHMQQQRYPYASAPPPPPAGYGQHAAHWGQPQYGQAPPPHWGPQQGHPQQHAPPYPPRGMSPERWNSYHGGRKGKPDRDGEPDDHPPHSYWGQPGYGGGGRAAPGYWQQQPPPQPGMQPMYPGQHPGGWSKSSPRRRPDMMGYPTGASAGGRQPPPEGDYMTTRTIQSPDDGDGSSVGESALEKARGSYKCGRVREPIRVCVSIYTPLAVSHFCFLFFSAESPKRVTFARTNPRRSVVRTNPLRKCAMPPCKSNATNS
jgi:hypothetical protein